MAHPRTHVLLLLLVSAPGPGPLLAAPRRSFTIRHQRGNLWLLGPTGQPLITLQPTLHAALRPYAFNLRHDRTLPLRRLRLPRLRWTHRADGGFSATATAQHPLAFYRFTLRRRGPAPWLELELQATYRRAALVQQELFRLRTGPSPRAAVLDRALRWTARPGTHISGHLTPHRLALRTPDGTTVRLEDDGSFQALVLRSSRGGARVDLELEHWRNHPLRTLVHCVGRSRRGARRARRDLSASYRHAGQRVVARARLLLSEQPLLLLGRYPRGLRAAIALTDHADQSSASRAEALAFGRTGALAAGAVGPGQPGLVNRGLSYTRTVFIERRPGYFRQLDSPTFQRVLDAMSQRGVEIGVHSPTGQRDRPADARRLLNRFRQRFAGGVWIDHQPETNCEAITATGWDPSGPWYMLGHLHELGFHTLWSALDLPLGPGRLNLLAPELPARRRPAIYWHHRLGLPDGHGPFALFNTAMLFVPRRQLLHRFSRVALDRFVAEHGLLLGHTYLDTARSRGRLRNRCLLRRVARGSFALRPEADQLFRELARRQHSGQLWITGVEALARHLLAVQRLRLQPLAEGGYLLTSPADLRGPVRDLTVLLAGGRARLQVDGGAPRGSRVGRDYSAHWFDLMPGRPYRLRPVDDHGRPLPATLPVQLILR